MKSDKQTKHIPQSAKGWIEPLAKIGFVSKGLIYSTIGILAALAAYTAKSEASGSRGALRTIFEQPFGRYLLLAVAVGLFGYAIWKFVQAIEDTEDRGSDWKGYAVRSLYAIVGVIYGSLIFFAVKLFLDLENSEGKYTPAEDWTATLLAQPFGQILVGAIGLGIVGFAFFQFYEAFTTKFREKLKTSEMSEKTEKIVVRIAQIGLSARGIVFLLIGIFLTKAAVEFRPETAEGIRGALRTLENQPYGWILLGIVAVGLIIYGLYMFIFAKYRKINV